MNKKIKYYEVCFGETDSICIKGTRKPSKFEAEQFLFNDMYNLGFDAKRGVTRVIEINREEAFTVFDMDETERKLPVFE